MAVLVLVAVFELLPEQDGLVVQADQPGAAEAGLPLLWGVAEELRPVGLGGAARGRAFRRAPRAAAAAPGWVLGVWGRRLAEGVWVWLRLEEAWEGLAGSSVQAPGR